MANHRKRKNTSGDQDRGFMSDPTTPTCSGDDYSTPPSSKTRRVEMSQQTPALEYDYSTEGSDTTRPIPKKQFPPWDHHKPPSAAFLVRYNDSSTWISIPTDTSTAQDASTMNATPIATAEKPLEEKSGDQNSSVDRSFHSKFQATQLDRVTTGVEKLQMQPSQTDHSVSKGGEGSPKLR
ncbi:hypothetical protein KC336_g5681 [Hortaea werneckii]|nr:hypothetical protein KC336_g5681 [Hortaea werneckii]